MPDRPSTANRFRPIDVTSSRNLQDVNRSSASGGPSIASGDTAPDIKHQHNELGRQLLDLWQKNAVSVQRRREMIGSTQVLLFATLPNVMTIRRCIRLLVEEGGAEDKARQNLVLSPAAGGQGHVGYELKNGVVVNAPIERSSGTSVNGRCGFFWSRPTSAASKKIAAALDASNALSSVADDTDNGVDDDDAAATPTNRPLLLDLSVASSIAPIADKTATDEEKVAVDKPGRAEAAPLLVPSPASTVRPHGLQALVAEAATMTVESSFFTESREVQRLFAEEEKNRQELIVTAARTSDRLYLTLLQQETEIEEDAIFYRSRRAASTGPDSLSAIIAQRGGAKKDRESAMEAVRASAAMQMLGTRMEQVAVDEIMARQRTEDQSFRVATLHRELLILRLEEESVRASIATRLEPQQWARVIRTIHHSLSNTLANAAPVIAEMHLALGVTEREEALARQYLEGCVLSALPVLSATSNCTKSEAAARKKITQDEYVAEARLEYLRREIVDQVILRRVTQVSELERASRVEMLDAVGELYTNLQTTTLQDRNRILQNELYHVLDDVVTGERNARFHLAAQECEAMQDLRLRIDEEYASFNLMVKGQLMLARREQIRQRSKDIMESEPPDYGRPSTLPATSNDNQPLVSLLAAPTPMASSMNTPLATPGRGTPRLDESTARRGAAMELVSTVITTVHTAKRDDGKEDAAALGTASLPLYPETADGGNGCPAPPVQSDDAHVSAEDAVLQQQRHSPSSSPPPVRPTDPIKSQEAVIHAEVDDREITIQEEAQKWRYVLALQRQPFSPEAQTGEASLAEIGSAIAIYFFLEGLRQARRGVSRADTATRGGGEVQQHHLAA